MRVVLVRRFYETRMRPIRARIIGKGEAYGVTGPQLVVGAAMHGVTVKVDLESVAGLEITKASLRVESVDVPVQRHRVGFDVAAPHPCLLLELAARRGKCIAQRDVQIFVCVVSTRFAVGMNLAAGYGELDVYPKRAALALMMGRSFDDHMATGDPIVKASEPQSLVSRHSFD